MSERRIRTRITFAHPFFIQSHNETFPPGNYILESYEEPVHGISFLAYRKTQSFLHFDAAGTATPRRRILEMDRDEISAALLADGKVQNNT
ncbi:hypothetical protein N9T38_01490 [SAR116 cluster bacterium]|nr:hypothetical protein [SAR116 cluster bacterium]